MAEVIEPEDRREESQLAGSAFRLTTALSLKMFTIAAE